MLKQRTLETITTIWRKNINTIASIWRENMLGYLLGYLSVSRSEHRELRGIENAQGQISEHIFRQMEAIVFIILQVFFTTRAFLKIRKYLTTIHR